MQPHDFKQAIIMFVFWGMMVVNIGFANFGWCVCVSHMSFLCFIYVMVMCVIYVIIPCSYML